MTSDFRPEVEIRPFRACAMHPAIIIRTVRSLWTLLWGSYHVPQNVFLVSRGDWSDKSEWYCRTVHCCQSGSINECAQTIDNYILQRCARSAHAQIRQLANLTTVVDIILTTRNVYDYRLPNSDVLLAHFGWTNKSDDTVSVVSHSVTIFALTIRDSS